MYTHFNKQYKTASRLDFFLIDDNLGGGAERHPICELPGEHCSLENTGSESTNTSSATGHYSIYSTIYSVFLQFDLILLCITKLYELLSGHIILAKSAGVHANKHNFSVKNS